MDYLTPGGSKVKLAPPHDFNSGQSIAFDLIPNIDDILNKVHSVGADGSYVMHDGSWVYQPQINSMLFHNGALNESESVGNNQFRTSMDPSRLFVQPQQQMPQKSQKMNGMSPSGYIGCTQNNFQPNGRNPMIPINPVMNMGGAMHGNNMYGTPMNQGMTMDSDGQWIRIG
ncbi:hypothetical protein Ciccas_005376 [Cichlidogyrus casuarinus]|uniref:Uncharacterized protein n=1 Tax=Cichlidogyrus casuarinus TaxID=1844966 RepID=A0ABD2Q8U8_9PLAT